MKITSDQLWAGTEAAHSKHIENMAAVDAKLASSSFDNQDGEEDKVPYLYEVQDGVGVISIKGPLTNRESWVNQYFGITSYGAIREALIYAAQDENVTEILLDIDSGGGAVNGVYDTGNLIKMVNDKVKPVTAYGENMASAAYWLGCSAGTAYAGKTSTVGSIGVIATHMEYSKQLKADGIGVTVMRSGKHKALANGVEPLTDAAKSQIQDSLDAAYKIFVEHVAECRNVPYAFADSNMADGKEFFGEGALTAGLVDGIKPYDEVIQDLIKKSVDTINNTDNNRGNSTQGGAMKRTLSTEQMTALAAEGGLALQAGDPEAVAVAAALAAEASQAAADLAAAESVAAALAEKAKAPAQADAGVVAMLQAQLKEANESLMLANVDVSKLKGQLDEAQSAQAGLLAIAAKSVNNMRAALNMSTLDAAAMTAASVLAEHAAMTAQFTATFKVGGVAAVEPATQEVKANPAPDALAAARLAAVNFTQSK